MNNECDGLSINSGDLRPPEDFVSRNPIRVYILPPLGAAVVEYQEYDLKVFLSGRPPTLKGTGDEAEEAEIAATTYTEFNRKES